MPDTAWPIHGHPPDLSRIPKPNPVLVPVHDSRPVNSDHLPDSHLTHQVRLFHIAHHDSLQPTQHETVWSLPPQVDSEGPRSFISRAAPHQGPVLHRLLLALRTHSGTP